MATLSTSAWVLHDLGLATGFGGALFGQLALHPSLHDVRSEEERGQLLHDVWAKYNVVNGVALGVTALTWVAGRSVISGRSIDATTRALVISKDIVVGAAIATGIATIVANRMMGGTAIRGAHEPSPRTPRKAVQIQRFLNVVGPINTGFIAGALGLTTILAMRAGKSAKWSFLSRFLP